MAKLSIYSTYIDKQLLLNVKPFAENVLDRAVGLFIPFLPETHVAVAFGSGMALGSMDSQLSYSLSLMRHICFSNNNNFYGYFFLKN